MVQAITLQPWRRSSRQSLAASEEALDQPWLAGRPWINLGEQSNAFFGSPPHNSTWGDRNYSCTLCIMRGTIAFHLELAPRRLLPWNPSQVSEVTQTHSTQTEVANSRKLQLSPPQKKALRIGIGIRWKRALRPTRPPSNSVTRAVSGRMAWLSRE